MPLARSPLPHICAVSGRLTGIKPARTCNVGNIAAHTACNPNRRNYWFWPGTGLLRSNHLANGVFALLNAAPSTDGG